MRLFLRLEDKQKSCAIWVVYLLRVTLPQVVTPAVIQTKERQEQLKREKAPLKFAEKRAQQQVKQGLGTRNSRYIRCECKTDSS